MGAQVQTNLSLDNAIDQQADNGEHRQGRNPFGFLEPHGRDRRRVLDPTKTRLYSGILLLIGFENLCVPLSARTVVASTVHPLSTSALGRASTSTMRP